MSGVPGSEKIIRWQTKPTGSNKFCNSVSAPPSCGVTLSQRTSACVKATGSVATMVMMRPISRALPELATAYLGLRGAGRE